MRRKDPSCDDDDWLYGVPWGQGYASPTGVHDEPEDVIARLHQVVKEVTGKEVEQKPKPRMGFL